MEEGFALSDTPELRDGKFIFRRITPALRRLLRAAKAIAAERAEKKSAA
jgi:hypothetical protein